MQLATAGQVHLPDGRFSLGAQTNSVTGAAVAARPESKGPWIYGPWLDLLVGCGAWSAPLLAIAMWAAPSTSHYWVVGFYLLAIIFNYPHFMATVYRAYHTHETFEKYKFFTLHLTLLLVLTGILLHTSYRLFPWVFTLYICWSPWHYTGQNYGLLMMFVRRAGATATSAERRWMRAAFIASYLMLLASFETGGSNDPLILSLGLPPKFTLLARVGLGGAFGICALLALDGLVRRSGFRAMIAPLTLVLTQFLWFVLPTILELRSDYHIPQTRYSSGILAVLHSAQYIWITSYFQRREARAGGQTGWKMPAYFVTLVAGGIALFIPGPWLVSYAFHYDFTTSFLIFMALVNIHHFLLDGALWKLRDTRVSSLLVGSGDKAVVPADRAPVEQTRSAFSRIIAAPAFRLALVALLFLWGGMDQIHFALGTEEGNLTALSRAESLNPYDATIEERIGAAETKTGNQDGAVQALRRAVEINPNRIALQEAAARAMIEDGRYADAYAHYQKMLKIFPGDADALVNYGLLAARLGHPEEAMDSWQSAAALDPDQANAHLYLAEGFDQSGEAASAVRHWKKYLQLTAAHPDDPSARAMEPGKAAIGLADDEARLHQSPAAIADYEAAVAIAARSGDEKLESVALAHLGDLQDKTGNARDAAKSYQRGLSLDAKNGDPASEAADWFNYGQFLRRRGFPDELAFACLLRAEDLLAGTGGRALETVKTMRREVETRLGEKASSAERNRPALLARAASLPAEAF